MKKIAIGLLIAMLLATILGTSAVFALAGDTESPVLVKAYTVPASKHDNFGKEDTVQVVLEFHVAGDADSDIDLNNFSVWFSRDGSATPNSTNVSNANTDMSGIMSIVSATNLYGNPDDIPNGYRAVLITCPVSTETRDLFMSGTYRMTYLIFQDLAGNQAVYGDSSESQGGDPQAFPAEAALSFTVDNPGADLTSPVVQSVIFNPTTADAGDDVDVTMQASDADGISSVEMTLTNDEKGYQFYPADNGTTFTISPVEGQPGVSTITGTLHLPGFLPPGTYHIAQFYITDSKGNMNFNGGAHLVMQDIDKCSIEVTNAGFQDHTPPTIEEFNLSSDTAYPGDTVTFNVKIKENGSAIKNDCDLRLENDGSNVAVVNLTKGEDGYYTGTYQIPDDWTEREITFGMALQYSDYGDYQFYFTDPDYESDLNPVLHVLPMEMDNPTSSGFYWTKDDLGVTINAYVGTAMTVVVPKKIGGGSVVKIGDSAFASCTSIRSVIIPEGVTEMGTYVFDACHKLATVSLPASLTAIGENAFSDCPSLISINLNGNTSFCLDAYGVLFDAGKTRLIVSPAANSRTSYTVPDTVTSIGASAFNNNTALQTITIPSSVQSIGSNAFFCCSGLKSAVLPTGISSVADGLFWKCGSLTSVTIPAGVKTIGGSAFLMCSSLANVTLPASLESIGDAAFFKSGLTKVNIPHGTTSIAYEAFAYCDSLTEFTVENGNTAYESRDGVLYKTKNDLGDTILALVQYPAAKAASAFEIPDGVTYLETPCFIDCVNLTSVSIPSSVGFADPNNPTYSDPSNFTPFSCCLKMLSVTVRGVDSNFAVRDGVLYTADMTYLLYYPSGKTNTVFTLPKEVVNVQTTFCYTPALVSFSVEAGSENFFTRDGSLYSTFGIDLTQPADDQWITMKSYPCGKTAETVTVEPTIEYPLGSGRFYRLGHEVDTYNYNKYIKNVIFADGCDSVGTCAFANCVNLETVVIPEGVTRIGQTIFFNCAKLKSITIPASVTEIEPNAFENCTGLETVTFAVGTKAAAGRKGGAGSSLTSIGDSTFDGCVSLKSVDIPDSVTSIGNSVFSGCDSLTAINVGSGNTAYSSQGGVLYDKAAAVLLQYPMNKPGSAFFVPASVRLIAEGAFSGSRNLTKISIPATVISIDTFAFSADAKTRMTIYGTAGSCAETYARSVGIPFSTQPLIVSTTYTVTFNSQGGGTVASKTGIAYNALIKAPAAPTRTGYTFGGWYKEAACTNKWDFSKDRVTDDTTLYAKWTANFYKVTFNSQGGSAVTSFYSQYDQLISAPDAPSRKGYAFAGWYREAACVTAWNFGTDKVTGNIILYAKWGINYYDVSFDSQGGGNVDSKTHIAFNSTFPAPLIPERTGYVFSGWFKEAACKHAWSFAKDKMPANNLTLFAKWSANTFAVSFNSQGGSAVKSKTVSYGSLISAPVVPRRTGFAFVGWFKEEGCKNPWDFGTDTVTAATTLWAKWNINGYTVTFNAMGGIETTTSVSADYRTAIAPPDTPTKDGFIFAGWYTSIKYTTQWSFATGKVTANVTLYAKWSVTAYTVSFNAQGGALTPVSQSVPYNGKAAEPTSPAKTGYFFGGWYTSRTSFTAATWWNFDERTVTGNITLYARWVSKLATPVVTAVSATDASVFVSCAAVPYATNFRTYRSTSSAGPWDSTSLISDSTAASYSDGSLDSGLVYYYRMQAYCEVDGVQYYSALSPVVTEVPGKPMSLDAEASNFNTVSLSWSFVNRYTGYEVWRATSASGKYSLVTTTGLQIFNDTVSTGTTYWYKVRAYRQNGTAKTYGAFSDAVTAQCPLADITDPAAASASATSVALSWDAVAGATKYEVWYAPADTGVFKLLTTTALTSYTQTKLVTGQPYYYKVRAYRLVGGKKVYGDYTDVMVATPGV